MGVMVMKDLVLKNIYFQRGKGGCGGLERTDFEQFLLWEGVVDYKDLILIIFYFRRMWR